MEADKETDGIAPAPKVQQAHRCQSAIGDPWDTPKKRDRGMAKVYYIELDTAKAVFRYFWRIKREVGRAIVH